MHKTPLHIKHFFSFDINSPTFFFLIQLKIILITIIIVIIIIIIIIILKVQRRKVNMKDF